MRPADTWKDYELLDATDGNRLERWGETLLVRPDPQVVWKTPQQSPLWAKADAVYHRSNQGGGEWEYRRRLPEKWKITCGEGDQLRIDMATICAQQLQAIGVDATVAVNAETDWAGQEAYLIGWGSPFDPDDHTYKVFGTDKGANYSGYSYDKVDELLKKARETDDDAQRKEYYQQFQQALTEKMPFTFIAYVDAIYVGRSNIQGITPDTVLGHHGVGIFWNIADWTLSAS